MRAAPALAVLLVAGCLLASPPAGASQTGPTLIFVVTNRTSEERLIGYEFEAEGTSGAGEGGMPCGRSTIGFGEIAGSYLITVDGQEVAAGQVPSGTPPGSYFVIRIEIDEEGSASAIGPEISARPPADRDLVFEICR